MPHSRSAAGRARQRARLEGHLITAASADADATRQLAGMGGITSRYGVDLAASVIRDRVTDRTVPARDGVTFRGAPVVPDTRQGLRDQTRARDLKIKDRHGNVIYDARDARRRTNRHEPNNAQCVCVGCIRDRRLAREIADAARRNREGGWA